MPSGPSPKSIARLGALNCADTPEAGDQTSNSPTRSAVRLNCDVTNAACGRPRARTLKPATIPARNVTAFAARSTSTAVTCSELSTRVHAWPSVSTTSVIAGARLRRSPSIHACRSTGPARPTRHGSLTVPDPPTAPLATAASAIRSRSVVTIAGIAEG